MTELLETADRLWHPLKQQELSRHSACCTRVKLIFRSTPAAGGAPRKKKKDPDGIVLKGRTHRTRSVSVSLGLVLVK
jgi:hypothetical protein